MKNVSFLKVFSLLKSQHGGVYKGAQKTTFGSFFETKTQQSQNACQKNLTCAKYTYFLCFFNTFLSACIGTRPWERQIDLNLGFNYQNIAYQQGPRAKIEDLKNLTIFCFFYSNLHISLLLIKPMKNQQFDDI